MALAGAGPNTRPRRSPPLSNAVIMSSCSVNCLMTFLMEIFSKITTVYENKKRPQIIGVDLYACYIITQQVLLWGVGKADVPPS